MRLPRVAAVAALVLAGLALPTTAATAASCDGSTSVGVGGLKLSTYAGSWEDSTYVNADQLVAYDSLSPMSGLRRLDRVYRSIRAACPADHIKIVGHSEGAAITHAWITAHPSAENLSAVLLSDPKRPPGPGSAGLAGNPFSPLIGYPLAGVDSFYGAVPVLQVCNRADVVCNEEAGWLGYIGSTTHLDYDFDADNYADDASGVWFN